MTDPNVNTQAEIYANIRDRALEEAAQEAIAYAQRCEANHWKSGEDAGYDLAGYIRALKGNADSALSESGFLRSVVEAFPDTEADGFVFCGKCGAQK